MSFSASTIQSVHTESNVAPAGPITILSIGEVSIASGAQIATYTKGLGKAGAINVAAGSLLIDGNGSEAGIVSKAVQGSTGDAGAISVHVKLDRGSNQRGTVNGLVLRRGAEVSSFSQGRGNSGTIAIDAETLTMEGSGISTRIFTGNDLSSTGSAGHVTVDVTGTLSMRTVAEISSSTFGPGAAGKIDVTWER
jgi:hypothetical protein